MKITLKFYTGNAEELSFQFFIFINRKRIIIQLDSKHEDQIYILQ